MGTGRDVEPCQQYPPATTAEELNHLVEVIKDWSIGNGLAVRTPPAVISPEADPTKITAVPAPVTLFPTAFPRQAFMQGQKAQNAYNELVIDGDDFVRDLWAVHETVKSEGYTQPLSLGLFRSDYMVHEDKSSEPPAAQAKQVEFNTIAASFGGLSVCTSKLHKFLAKTEYPLISQPLAPGALDLPENNAISGLAGGIEAAYHAYGDSELGHDKCVIFLVQGGERNVFDQRHLEYQISKSTPTIPVFRLAFTDIMEHTSLAKSCKRQLLYALPTNRSKVFEVAVVYVRAGYGPGDYPDQQTWDARCHLERSHAIKCPTVLTQVAGIKKVQQILATPRPLSEPSILSKFIQDDTPSAVALWNTFTNIYPMDTSDVGLEARKKALDPEQCVDYVLKPQREGGGNNIYGSAIPDFLKQVPDAHWNSYILMELIKAPAEINLILRNGNVENGRVISELGIYGTCLWNQETGEVIRNEQAGWLLRTKGEDSQEGGVAAGYGCMDSVSLI
ncbi:glutathione synthetase large chain [Metarhizium album ARSEF 1941]|uniref:Glutathione synthetase n=1 Tax=Metarhizium album (strain ARSEF 1941) TaxID=1081103 RepID=A0A0B2X2M0_METAS|nr:glutathione synthetase large chain [Metarhizium album ARSEF 1941]KHN99510.1 glutathione synthetase large chain [Metarhizium album ARSEF 1941]